MNNEKLAELIGCIYTAALDDQVWSHVLAMLAERLGCDQAAMRIMDLDDYHFVSQLTSDLDDDQTQAFSDHFAILSPYLSDMKTQGVGGDRMFVFNGRQVVHLEEAEALLGQQPAAGIFGFVFRVNSHLLHLAVGGHQPLPDRDEAMHVMSQLVGHFQQVFMIIKRIAELESRLDSMEQVLGRFSSGVILLDDKGQVSFMNRRARELIAGMRGLNMVANQLVGTSDSVTQKLRQMISAVVEEGRNGGGQIGALNVPNHVAKVDLSIIAVPLHAHIKGLQEGGERIQAALLVGSSRFASGLSAEVLQLLFNLTGAEARLSLALAMGVSVEQYCDDNSIRANTARGYLKSIFQKTETNRQQELISLLRSMPFYLSEETPGSPT